MGHSFGIKNQLTENIEFDPNPLYFLIHSTGGGGGRRRGRRRRRKEEEEKGGGQLLSQETWEQLQAAKNYP